MGEFHFGAYAELKFCIAATFSISDWSRRMCCADVNFELTHNKHPGPKKKKKFRCELWHFPSQQNPSILRVITSLTTGIKSRIKKTCEREVEGSHNWGEVRWRGRLWKWYRGCWTTPWYQLSTGGRITSLRSRWRTKTSFPEGFESDFFFPSVFFSLVRLFFFWGK